MTMDSFVNEKDYTLLAGDRYTFAVLDRILRGSCEMVRSDHENVILCHSAARYPVWIWTPDGCAETVRESAWNLAAECRPVSDGYHFNMKYELADYFIRRAAEEGQDLGIFMQLFAYDCPDPITPEHIPDGRIHCCTEQDAGVAADMLPLFYKEIGDKMPSRETCLEKVMEYIENNAFFFWKNAEGENVACCSYKCNQGLASLGSVFTRPEYRRNHYAQQLVYEVTKRVQEMGYIPMLYTDADYPASNACYEKIGYQLRGKLCTITLKDSGTEK